MRIDKPWGYEEWFAQTDKYVGKVLFVKEGHSLSLQYHERKDETLYILDGMAGFTIDGKCTIEIGGRSVHILPLVEHRVEAIVDTTIIEVSTPEVNDIVRLKDNYGRVTEAAMKADLTVLVSGGFDPRRI